MVSLKQAQWCVDEHKGTTILSEGGQLRSAHTLGVEDDDPDELYLLDPYGELIYIHDAGHLQEILNIEEITL